MFKALAFAVFAACAASPDPDCAQASEHVAACYGSDVGQAFAQTCTADTAQAALAEPCAPSDGGKADGFGGSPILGNPVEQFKYGTIGADELGIPLAVFRALPLVC